MPRPIRLFVSCSPDLGEEREMLGRLIAALPVSVGWDVAYTPVSGELQRPGLITIADSDLLLVLLGHDFAAPMGVEWTAAMRLERPLLAFRKNVLNSPSAQLHLRETRRTTAWEEFDAPDDLRRKLTPRLAQLLLDRGEYFGLQLPEVEGLLALARAAADQPPASEASEDARRGAGRGGIILGRGNL
jgi:hypothetical protein